MKDSWIPYDIDGGSHIRLSPVPRWPVLLSIDHTFGLTACSLSQFSRPISLILSLSPFLVFGGIG